MFLGHIYVVGRHFLLFTALLIFIIGCSAETPLPTRIVPAQTAAVPPTSQPAPTNTPAATVAPQNASTTQTPPTETPSLTPGPTESPSLEPIIYVVQAGDTLTGIALEYGVDVGRLRQVNGLTSDLININQELVIPPAVSSTESDIPVYYVEGGENFTSIAVKFGISPESLQAANPNVDPASLQVGQAILLPLGEGEIHYTVPGDSLLAIALRYDVSMDDLVQENAAVLNIDNLDFLPIGLLLKIPQENAAAGYDCSPQPARTEVIEYTVKNGEKLFCLSEKFGISMTTLLYANFNKVVGEGALNDGLTLLIPYDEGALYTISEDDIASETSLQDLMLWYGVQLFEQVTDWQNNPVSEPFEEGQQIFIHDADLLAGTYQPPVMANPPTPVPDDPNSGDNSPGDTDGGSPDLPPPPRPDFTDYPQPVGDPPPGAVFPLGTPWISVTELDTGFCPVVSGFGWTGGLSWPVSGRTINENRGFRLGHSGIDINSPLGDPAFAAQSGTVVWAGWSTWGFGNLVVIAHGGTWHTYYAHLSEVYVSCGQSVGAGTTIGATGQTGAATWPHLHFEVRNQGFSYNPANYLP